MTVGRQLWALILVKVALLFLVFKLFFFPDLLERDYGSDPERAEATASAIPSRLRYCPRLPSTTVATDDE